MAVIHHALVLSGPANWPDSSIDKSEAIIQCGLRRLNQHTFEAVQVAK